MAVKFSWPQWIRAVAHLISSLLACILLLEQEYRQNIIGNQNPFVNRLLNIFSYRMISFIINRIKFDHEQEYPFFLMGCHWVFGSPLKQHKGGTMTALLNAPSLHETVLTPCEFCFMRCEGRIERPYCEFRETWLLPRVALWPRRNSEQPCGRSSNYRLTWSRLWKHRGRLIRLPNQPGLNER